MPFLTDLTSAEKRSDITYEELIPDGFLTGIYPMDISPHMSDITYEELIRIFRSMKPQNMQLRSDITYEELIPYAQKQKKFCMQ